MSFTGLCEALSLILAVRDNAEDIHGGDLRTPPAVVPTERASFCSPPARMLYTPEAVQNAVQEAGIGYINHMQLYTSQAC